MANHKVYYFYLGRSKSKAKRKIHSKRYAFAIAFDARDYTRTCQSRGWTDTKQVYWRFATDEEIEIQENCLRVLMGRYETLDELLDDERIILGEDSKEFKNLKYILKAVADQNTYYPKL